MFSRKIIVVCAILLLIMVLIAIFAPEMCIRDRVENSVKHGKMIGKTLKITITAKLLETEEGCMADLSVADNGTGFTAGDLKQLNSAAPQEENGQHVGLFNVVRRRCV